MGTYIKTFTANLACDVNQPLTKVGEDLTYRIVSPDDLIIDGITATVGDIILFRGQDNSSLNIVAKLNEIIDMGATNWYNFIIPPEFLSINTGDNVYIQSGFVYMDVSFRLTASQPFTFDNSEITWSMYGLVSPNGGPAQRTGDSREACGITFMQGLDFPTAFTFDGNGEGTITLNNAGNTITVTGSVTNPNFIDMGYVVGDEIVVYDNAANFDKYTLTDVAETVLTIDSVAPNMTGGNSAICLVPNAKLSASDLRLILDTIIGSVIFGFEIVLDNTEEPNIFRPSSSTSNTISNCVSLGNGILFSGFSQYRLEKSSFYNSSSGVNSNCIAFTSQISNIMSNCHIIGSASNIVGATVTGITNALASQISTTRCVVVNFNLFGIRYNSSQLSSSLDSVINCPRAMDVSFASSGTINGANIEGITIFGIQLDRVSNVFVLNVNISEADPSFGIRALNLSRFNVVGGTNTATTPYDPAVALTPNATGGEGVGY